MFFSILATFAEFEADLLKMRTREGMAVARAKGKLKGSSPNCRPASRPGYAGCTPPTSAPSPASPRCSSSPEPPCTASSNEPRRPRAPDLTALILRSCRSEISGQSFLLAAQTPGADVGWPSPWPHPTVMSTTPRGRSPGQQQRKDRLQRAMARKHRLNPCKHDHWVRQGSPVIPGTLGTPRLGKEPTL